MVGSNDVRKRIAWIGDIRRANPNIESNPLDYQYKMLQNTFKTLKVLEKKKKYFTH